MCLLLGITVLCTFLYTAPGVREQVFPGYEVGVEFLPHLTLPGYAKLYSSVVVLIYPFSHQQYRALSIF